MFTEYAGHARDMAQDLDVSNLDALVVAGGDGSFHEVVNGLMMRDDPKDIALGLIPCRLHGVLYLALPLSGAC